MKDKTALFNSYLSLAGYTNGRVLTIMQDDYSELTFEMKDINGEIVDLNEVIGQVQFVDSDRDILVATSEAVIAGGKATFSIGGLSLPADDYEIYVKVDNQYYPSTENSFILKVIPAYDVVDDSINLDDIQTIDIVVEALKEDVIEALSSQVEEAVLSVINADEERFRGLQGEPLRFEDLTPDQVDQITGEDAIPLTPSQMSPEDLELIRGRSGDSAYQVAVSLGYEGTEEEWVDSLALHFDDLTSEEVDQLKIGILSTTEDEEGNTAIEFTDGTVVTINKGATGDKGDAFTYEDFTPEQLEALQGIDGKDFTFDMFTPEQLESFKGESGKDFEFEDFTPEQLNLFEDNIISDVTPKLQDYLVENPELFKGEDGVGIKSAEINEEDELVLTYDDDTFVNLGEVVGREGLSAYQLAQLNGYEGNETEWLDSLKGDAGESFDYESLTPEQIAELQEGLPVRPPKIYTYAEYYALDSYDPQTLYFVVEEDDGGIPQ